MGQAISFGFILLGIMLLISGRRAFDSVWFLFLGWFLFSAARTAYRRTRLQQALSGYTVDQVMTDDYPRVPLDMPVPELLHGYFLERGYRWLPVADAECVVGYVTVRSLKRVPRERWDRLRAGDVMEPANGLPSVPAGTGLWEALQQMGEEGVPLLPVRREGLLVGVLGQEAVRAFLRARSELKP
jgi:CBS domain-containing protein